MGSSSATALTTSTATAYLKSEVWYTYGWGQVSGQYEVYNSYSATAGYASATASASHYNPESIRARSKHLVEYGSYVWNPTLTIN
jgi:hypothetical protein